MTQSEMLSWFDLVQDKANAPYFTDAEKYEFLNRAQTQFMNELLNVFETDETSSTALAPLIIVDEAQAATSGVIAFNDLTSDARKILSVRVGTSGSSNFTANADVRFVRLNDFDKIKGNAFKKPTAANPVYRYVGDTVYPAIKLTGAADATTEGFVLSYVRYPADIAADQVCEFPDWTHNEIVAIGLVLAGISSKDEALVMLRGVGKPV